MSDLFTCFKHNTLFLTQRNTAQGHNYSQLNLFEMVYKSKALTCKQDTQEQDMMVLRREEYRKYKLVIKIQLMLT